MSLNINDDKYSLKKNIFILTNERIKKMFLCNVILSLGVKSNFRLAIFKIRGGKDHVIM